jgi:hypothetical protein
MPASSSETTHIVSGPIPDEFGNACFVVQVGGRRVTGIATPNGSGVGDDGFEVAAQVMSALSDFRREAHDRLQSCLREAAQLRRAAGHATELAVPVPDSIVVQPTADVRESGVTFTVNVGSSSVLVLVTKDGALLDNYDPVFHPNGEVEPQDLLAARRAVLDFVLTHPESARAGALDCELLDLFWK